MAENTDIPWEFSDVVTRRLKSVSGDVRQDAIGTRGIQSSFWRMRTHIIFAFGDSKYQTALKTNHKRYGKPIPGLAYSISEQTGVFNLRPGSRMSSIGRMTLECAGDTAVSFSTNCSLLGYDLGIVLSQGINRVKFANQLFFVASLTDDFTLRDAAADLEGVLVRTIGEHIKRAPLSDADR